MSEATSDLAPLPAKKAAQLAALPEQSRWLVENLFADEAVGIIGGEPKCCKSFLALDIAVSVASGAPCLGRFPVKNSGRVLLFAAEDALHTVRQRLLGICLKKQVDFEALDVFVITQASVRLDLEVDRKRLLDTLVEHRPHLLILDPFVRLHRGIDENDSGQVAALLAYLRHLQRLFHCAVIVVHHAKKSAHAVRAGQALRGSSEFHAWGDSNLYLRRSADALTLSVEHRAAAAIADLPLALEAKDDAVALGIVDRAATAQAPAVSIEDKVRQALAGSAIPLPLSELRERCHLRKASLLAVLSALSQQGALKKTNAGYALAT